MEAVTVKASRTLQSAEGEICSAPKACGGEKKLGASKRTCSERSSDSSPLSGVSSVISKARALGAVASKDVPEALSGPPKRLCVGSASASTNVSTSLKKKFAPYSGKAGSEKLSPKAEYEVTSGSFALLEGAKSGSSPGGDQAEMGTWQEAQLDFNLDSGDVDDLGPSAQPQIAPQQSVDTSKNVKDSNQDSQSEAAPATSDAPDLSDQHGADGTSSCGGKNGKVTPPGKRKVKVDWSPELHRRFVQAVEQLGVEKAIPSRILELMGVKCLTRHNIASHLQKYRSHRRHLAAREAEAANWQQQRKAAEAPLWPMAKPGNAPMAWGPYVPAAIPGAPPAGFPAMPGMSPAGPVPGRPVVGMPPPGMVQGMPHPQPMPGTPSPGHVIGQPQAGPMGGAPMPAIGVPMQPMQPMQVWGHPTMDHSQGHMWQRQGAMYPMPPPAWYGPDGSLWHYPAPFQSAPPLEMWGQPPPAAPGFPGAAVVAGTPCFPPQMMQMPAGPQRMPSGVSSTGSVPGFPPMVYPAAPGAPAPLPSGADASTVSGSPSSAVTSSAAATASDNAEGLDALHMDNFLDEALSESIFSGSDDFGLGLASGQSSGPETFPDHETSSLLDAAISEALANPSTPLPLGLKPPSVDGVLEELNKQGITMLPPLKGCASELKGNVQAEDIEALGEVDDHALMFGADLVDEHLSDDELAVLLDP